MCSRVVNVEISKDEEAMFYCNRQPASTSSRERCEIPLLSVSLILCRDDTVQPCSPFLVAVLPLSTSVMSSAVQNQYGLCRKLRAASPSFTSSSMTGGGSSGHLEPLAGEGQPCGQGSCVRMCLRFGFSPQMALPTSGSCKIDSWNESLYDWLLVSLEPACGM